MTVLMVAAALYGVAQVFAVSWPTRSVRAGTVLLAVLVGVYACGTAVALLEVGYTRAVADHTGRSLVDVVNTTSYTTAPWVEELVKMSPLLLAGAYAKVRRQWGLTDFTVLGAALGAGFGLLEALLRYSLDAHRALERYGGWIVPDSLSPPYVPGPGEVFTSWLPAPAATLGLGPTGDVTVATFNHLAWTALAGLAVGVLLRARGRLKPLAVIPFAAAATHHTLTNYVAQHPGGDPGQWLDTLDARLWAAPLAALLLAMAADTVCLHRGKHTLPGVLLAAERADGDTPAALLRYASWRPPWTPLIALRFLRLRRALCYATAAAPAATVEPLRRAVADLANRIDATDHEQAWRSADIRSRVRAARAGAGRGGRLLRLVLVLIPCVLMLPSVVFLGIGSFTSTDRLQEYFTTGPGLKILTACAAAALAWIAWQLIRLLRTWHESAAALSGEQLAFHRFRFLSAAASAVTGSLLFRRGTGPAGFGGQVVPRAHLLDALDHFLVYLGFALLLLSLLALFPPGGGLALAGVAASGEGALGAALALRLGAAGVALMAAGAAGGDSGGSGERAEGGDGDARSGSIDESEKQFNAKETRIAETLRSEGKHVKALKESTVEGEKTPDALVDGVPTEFKTLDPGAGPGSVKNTLNTAKKQARDAIVDARQSGLDEAGAREGLGKFLRNNPPDRMNSVRIMGDGYQIRWP